jgi:hypothetical protein
VFSIGSPPQLRFHNSLKIRINGSVSQIDLKHQTHSQGVSGKNYNEIPRLTGHALCHTTFTGGGQDMTKSSERKRFDWLEHKSRTGHLTKQEQLELGEAYLKSDPAKKMKK